MLNANPSSKTKIELDDGFFNGLMSAGKNSTSNFEFSCIIKDKTSGRTITRCARDIQKNSDGSIFWHNQVFRRPANSDLKIYSGMSTGLYGGVEAFLKDVTQDWPQEAKDKSKIYTYGANSGFSDTGYKGALLWAKHYFEFDSDRGRDEWKRGFENQIASAKTRIPRVASDLALFKTKLSDLKHPYQFVKSGILVNKAEAETFSGGLDFDFKEIFKDKPMVDLAELMLIKSGMGLSGHNHFNKSSGGYGDLNERRTAYYQSRGSQRGSSTPTPAITSERVRRYLTEEWGPAKGRSLVMTTARLREMESWTRAEVEEFYQHAPITPSAKQRVKDILERIGG
jgi:hypothetical protein